MFGMSLLTRREVLTGIAAWTAQAARPSGLLIDTHIHLFDPARFPYHPAATYQPPPERLDEYAQFVTAAKIDHAIIVHPEPYQDDHRYLEYCFEHEPRKGFFKGTCLFDPLKPDTPARMAALTKKWPNRIVALRVHENRKAGEAPWDATRPIRERDMGSAEMRRTWKAAADLGLAIQMHFIPRHAASIAKLAAEFPQMPVVLDHMGRAGEGSRSEFEQVLALAKLPNPVMKFSGWSYLTKTPHPHADIAPTVQKLHAAFGADRMIWGGLGMNMAQFDKATAVFDAAFSFATEADKAKVRGLTAQKLYRL
jgi:predicted TIM-barrel fold metal-dependent hydrolase